MSAQQPINNQPDMTQVDVMPTDTTQVITETPAVVETTSEVPTQEVAQTTMNPEAEAAGVTPEQQQQLDNQVVDTVASAIAEDQITARDIMVAVLMNSNLGVSPSAANALVDLFATDLMNEVNQVAPETAQVDTTMNNDVPPVV